MVPSTSATSEDPVSRSPVGKYVSEGDIKRTDDGPSVVGGTHLGNVKQSDDGPSVVGITQCDMRYAEVVSKC